MNTRLVTASTGKKLKGYRLGVSGQPRRDKGVSEAVLHSVWRPNFDIIKSPQFSEDQK